MCTSVFCLFNIIVIIAVCRDSVQNSVKINFIYLSVNAIVVNKNTDANEFKF